MNIGRPREFDPDQVLDQAMHVFWAQGYKNTSLQDLLDATGLSKSSLYQAYGSKHQLFIATVDHYYTTFAKEMSVRFERAGTGFAFIEGFLNDAVRETEGSACRRGCLLVNTANECAQGDAAIADAVSKGFEKVKSILYRAIEQGRVDGSVSPHVNSKFMASYLLSSMTGLRTMVKGGAATSEIRHIVAIVLSNLTK